MPIQRRVLKGFLISRSPVSWIGDAAALHADPIIALFKETSAFKPWKAEEQEGWTQSNRSHFTMWSLEKSDFFFFLFSYSSPVTQLQLCSGQLLKAITSFNTEKQLVARKHLRRILTLPIHFAAWTTAECITTLTITSRVIMNNDKITMSLCRCNSYHLLECACVHAFI